MDAMSDLRSLVAELRGDMNDRFTEVNGRLTELRADMNSRFGGVDRRFDGVDGRLAALDQKGDRHFTWLVSTQVAVLLAVIGALLGAYYQ
jgi:hypothetical protein